MMRICMVFNHFQISDGVAKSAIGIANLLHDQENVEICLRPLFVFDKSICHLLSESVQVKPVFGFYFKGLAKLVDLIPGKILYKLIVNQYYDIEIGFQYGLSTKVIANSNNYQAKHYAWMHTYDEGLLQKKDYQKMDKIVCVSACNAVRLAEELDNGVPVEYSYNPIDDVKIRQMGQETCPLKKGKELTFVTVGRLSPEKGFSRLLDCVARLKKEGYSLKLWLIGKGDEEASLHKKAKDLNIADCVVFTGEQSNPHRYTANADVFVCSSFSEGYSTACTEAILLEVPVLTTGVSGGEEIIRESEAGMLVGLEDEDLYQGMKSILENPQIVDEWKNTLHSTKERFTQKARSEKLLKVLGLA